MSETSLLFDLDRADKRNEELERTNTKLLAELRRMVEMLNHLARDLEMSGSPKYAQDAYTIAAHPRTITNKATQ